jgi:hypothetical protein
MKTKASLFIALFVVGALSRSTLSTEPIQGLIAHYEFDEDGGVTAYDSAGGYDGTVFGAVWTAGKIGGALQFDGVDEYVALPDNDPIWLPDHNFTISMWVYFEREPGSIHEVILDLNRGASSHFADALGCIIHTGTPDAGRLRFAMTTTTSLKEHILSEDILIRNKWYHIAAIRDGTTQLVYLGGVLNSTATCSNDPIKFVGGYDDNKINVGRYTTSAGVPDYHFNGSIDDVRLYERALSNNEIAQIYRNGAGGLRTYVDLKPRSCPNPLNVTSRGVLPVAILGWEDFDVSEIDVATVRLAGVEPVRSSFEDVATPLVDGSECDCTEEGSDGYLDLTLKFKTRQIAEQLFNTVGDVNEGEVLVLPVTGALYDGTAVEGEDCFRIAGKAPRALAAKKADVNGDGIVNIYDYALIAAYWLEYAVVDY